MQDGKPPEGTLEREERRAEVWGKVVIVGLFTIVGIVALSTIAEEPDPFWMVVYAVTGLGSLGMAVKAARE